MKMPLKPSFFVPKTLPKRFVDCGKRAGLCTINPEGGDCMKITKDAMYPRLDDTWTIYLKNAITNPAISVGDYTMYHDFVHDPREFEKRNVLYQYPINGDRLKIGKFCSIACGAKFLFNSANHALGSLSTYPFPIFADAWGLDWKRVTEAWDNKGDITIGNDVWIGYEAVILAGVTIGWRHHWYKGSSHQRCAALYNCGRCACKAHPQTVFRGNHCRFGGNALVGLGRRKNCPSYLGYSGGRCGKTEKCMIEVQ